MRVPQSILATVCELVVSFRSAMFVSWWRWCVQRRYEYGAGNFSCIFALIHCHVATLGRRGRMSKPDWSESQIRDSCCNCQLPWTDGLCRPTQLLNAAAASCICHQMPRCCRRRGRGVLDTFHSALSRCLVSGGGREETDGLDGVVARRCISYKL